MTASPARLSPTQLGAYFAFTEVSALLRHAVEKQLRDVGRLSYVQFQLLARLGDSPDGRQRMTDLADGVVYSRSGLTYQAQLLEERGLVTRSPSPEDERSTVVAVTDAGRTVLAEVFPGHVELVSSLLFGDLSDGDVDELARILERTRDNLRAIPPRSAAPRRRRTP
ncbi:MarR family winged helix-turn-helix transcriptional regulator [Microbacterium marinilacus]|uniref:MarR family transcriptional regulator n=1 Tax=Microbacterium marinilacus TaxID=415209 RepID=A0ABP7AZV3_9MICO|nr:MarR family winged helix-turn-helix transcriptional regulator [Microbacterium marinilacus]MBY0690085.1 MarR family winged helix-turn-helix transcriptional regulator [Microbacterium marinilacus]